MLFPSLFIASCCLAAVKWIQESEKERKEWEQQQQPKNKNINDCKWRGKCVATLRLFAIIFFHQIWWVLILFPPISTYIIYIVRFVRFSFDDMFFSSKATHTTWNNSLINRNQTHYVPFSTIIRLQFIDSPFNQEAECNMHFASPHPLLKLVCRRETMHSPLSRSMALFIGVFTIYTALFSISFVRPVTVVLAPLVM